MKRLQLNLDLTAVIVMIAVGVFLPVLLATASGIVALVLAEDAGGIVTGVLIVSFAVTAAGSALITVVLMGRKAALARRQADFVAHVSHEFRTPLSAIRLYTQTLQSGRLQEDPEAAARCLATILREAAWLDVLVDRVLTWRASATGQLPLDMVSASVAPAITAAVQRFQAMVPPDEIAWTCRVETRLPVRHDPDALNAVLMNLFINAYKYTGPDKRIGLEVRDEAGEVVVEIADNGLGMTPAECKRIFQPFYRSRGKAEKHAGGVGLGLSVARHLVNQHRGSISVTSEKDRGSTFIVRLPADTVSP